MSVGLSDNAFLKVIGISERRCGRCGKSFIPAPQHALKDARNVYCSCTCFMHRKDGTKKKKVGSKRRVEQYTKDGEYIQTFIDSETAAKSVNCAQNSIMAACRKGKSCRGYMWKYTERTKDNESDCATETIGQSEKGS